MTDTSPRARRQRIRLGIVFASVLLFPLTMNYLSPYVIVDAAWQGIVNASLVSFAVLFVSSLALGRSWCAWVCPGAGLQDLCSMAQPKPVNRRKADWVKWAIWVPWVGSIIAGVIAAGGYHRIELLHLTESGVSVSRLEAWPVYLTVVGLFLLIALLVGRRGACHSICWMAPFMIIGRKMRNLGRWPSLRLVARQSTCTNCGTCTRNCSMSLDVNAMVQQEAMEHAECILCGSCVDGCPSKSIRYRFCSGA